MANLQKSVCIYCGSRDGARPAYAWAATDVGEMLARKGWRLVYGAGDVGLMGRVAKAAQTAGGRTFGVIPVHLLDMEVGKRDLDTFIITETMHERKKVMIMNADAVVMLPGGAGSLDELFEALTWRQLGLHEKPIFILNTERLNQTGFTGEHKAWKVSHDQRKFREPFFDRSTDACSAFGA